MVRFIDLTNQITEGVKEFAFFNTVNDTFLEFQNTQTWTSIKEFKEDFNSQFYYKDIIRFLNLIPKDFFNEI